jgi:hypothetical protein
MLEALFSILLFAVPTFLGYVAARRLAHPCLPLLALCVVAGFIFFALAVRYAAFSLSLIFSLCVLVGYVAGRSRPPRRTKPPADA